MTDSHRKRPRPDDVVIVELVEPLCLPGRVRVACVEGRGEILGHVLESSVDVESPLWSSHATVVASHENAPCRLRLSSDNALASLSATDPAARPTRIPDTWKQALDDILSNQDPPWIAVVGGRGTGRTTACRYAVNRLLQTHPQIALVDMDTRQPLLSVPGLLSWTFVEQPLMNPPPLAARPQSAYWYGHDAVADDPTRYTQLVGQLLADVVGRDSHLPVVLHTDGWIKGLGETILPTLLQTFASTHPLHVVQLQGTVASRMVEVPLEGQGLTVHLVESFDAYSNDSYPSAASSLPVQAPLSVPYSWLQALRWCHYFFDGQLPDFTKEQGLVDPSCRLARELAARCPYVVPLDDVQLQVASDPGLVDEQILLDICNGSLVGLCCQRTKEDAEEESALPPQCVGLGIVRSIDRARRLLYVLTPLDVKDLEDVDLLVQGSVTLPLEFFYQGVWTDSFAYLNATTSSAPPTMVLGMDPMASRNSIARKGLAAAANNNTNI